MLPSVHDRPVWWVPAARCGPGAPEREPHISYRSGFTAVIGMGVDDHSLTVTEPHNSSELTAVVNRYIESERDGNDDLIDRCEQR